MARPSLYDDPKLYDLVVGRGPCEAFYRALARRVGGPVLELACGTGRLTLPLAADGHKVLGGDTSRAMLAEAAAKAVARHLEIAFVHGAMQTVALDRRFPLAIVSCNSLAHLTSNKALAAALANIRRHLAPGGLFAFDIVNPDIRALARAEKETVLRTDAVAIEEVAVYDPIRQVRSAVWRIRRPPSKERELTPFRLRLIFPQELQCLLGSAGLELVARYGDFDRNPLTATSPNQVCVARAKSGSVVRR